jgi:ABC-type sugar transport system ATPase subunit
VTQPTHSAAAATIAKPAVAARHISKRYGGTRALDDVSLAVFPGTVVALLGENGAGKSTLVKILAGAIQPDAGEIVVAGRPVALTSPAQARRSGIAAVHQELSLFPSLRVISNVFAGSEEHGVLGWMRWPRMRAELTRTLAEVGWSIPLDREVRSLTLAEQQMVEIVRAFHFQADLVLLDEPNSALTEAESLALYDAVRRLRARGQAFLLVSHRIDEVLEIADYVAILRDGRMVHTALARELTVREVVRLMVGTAESRPTRTVAKPKATQPVRLAVEDLHVGRLAALSLRLHRGEILGVAGLEGAGVQDLFDALFGLRRLAGGEVALDGAPYRPRSPADAIRAGVASIPADRRTEGLLMNRSVGENVVLLILRRLCNAFGLVPDEAIMRTAREFMRRFRIRSRSADAEVISLSGGNQQKVMLAKWLALQPGVILLNDPTRGIDVGAKAEVHAVMRELARSGVSVMVWSSEADDLLGVCDRIVVLNAGRSACELDSCSTDRRALLLAVVGGESEAVARGKAHAGS